MSKKYLSWYDDVIVYHQACAGISIQDGVLRSLLCSKDSTRKDYQNDVDATGICYIVPNRPRNLKAFEVAREKGLKVRVFQKEAKNRWLDLGFFVVSERMGVDEDEAVTFRLEKAQ